MTRADLLRAAIRLARGNGFKFRKWYVTKFGGTWQSFEDAVTTLDKERRYYALLFSHEFAYFFWKPGVKIAYIQPKTTYTRVSRDGKVVTIRCKTHIRRTTHATAWRYHLQHMVLSDDPLRYLRKFMLLEEDIIDVPVHVRTDDRPVTDDEEVELPPTESPVLEGTVAATRAEMEKMDYGDDYDLPDDDDA
jgi:hypothetical protein